MATYLIAAKQAISLADAFIPSHSLTDSLLQRRRIGRECRMGLAKRPWNTHAGIDNYVFDPFLHPLERGYLHEAADL